MDVPVKAWTKLRVRDRRALTAGVLLLVPALAFSFVIQPYRRARAELRDRVIEQTGLLARELGIVAAVREVPSQIETAAQALARRRPRLITGRDPLAATATLVQQVGEEARRHGVLLEAIETRAAESAGGGLAAVRIDVRGRADLEGLLRWLRAIEGGQRLLRVEGLTVARSDAGTEPDSADTETLLVATAIRGFVLHSGGDRP